MLHADVVLCRVFLFRAKGGVGEAADFDAVRIGQDGGTVQVVGVYPGECAVRLLGHAYAVEIVIHGGSGDT